MQIAGKFSSAKVICQSDNLQFFIHCGEFTKMELKWVFRYNVKNSENNYFAKRNILKSSDMEKKIFLKENILVLNVLLEYKYFFHLN